MPNPTLNEEKLLWKQGIEFVIGIDEVGRGAFAGSVVTAAVVFDKNNIPPVEFLATVNDSKMVSEENREIIAPKIRQYARHVAIAEVSVSTINKVGIGKATQIAFRKAVTTILKTIAPKNQSHSFFVLVDGFHVKYIKSIGLKRQKAIIKGDQKSISIAAASIIAKVYRDKTMKVLNTKYPQYHFRKNKGYGTKQHQKAIKKYGLSKIHRTSFQLEKFL